MIATRFAVLTSTLTACLLLSGCDATHAANQIDPYKREGMWRPEGVNAGNIAAQLADPRDLVRGRGDSGPQVKQAANAVTRIWAASVGPAQAPGGAAGLLRGAAGGGEAGGAPR